MQTLAAMPLPQDFLGPLLAGIEQYYTRKVTTHGATPLGADWSCVPTQEMRFVQLLKLCNFGAHTTLNDVGCGYGALLAFLAKRHRSRKIDYLGVDLSPSMIAQAQRLWNKRTDTAFAVGSLCTRVADYSVASGIFNVKLNQPEELWERFIAKTLADLHSTSRHGFAVNFLAPAPTDTPHIPELYRVPPDTWAAHCSHTFKAQVEVIGNYGMREHTLLVRKK